jgi:hypothetical protein
VSNTVPICQRGRSKVDRRPLLEFGWITSLTHLNDTSDQPGTSSAGLFDSRPPQLAFSFIPLASVDFEEFPCPCANCGTQPWRESTYLSVSP